MQKEMTDDEINALFAAKCAEYYSYDREFAASLRPVITSHKQSRKISHEITAANPLSIKVIDGVEYQLSRRSILEIKKKDGDNPTIGLLLCKSKNNLVAEYSLKDMSKPIGVSEYQITGNLPEGLAEQLPSVEI